MKELKALEILKEGLDFMNQAIKVNPNSIKELQSEIDRYVEAIDEFEELNNKSCSKCNNNIFNKGKKEYGCNRIEINPSDMKQAGFYCSIYEAVKE